ncbi:excinuclease ABC subunit C [Nostoc sp. 'Peltigera membranacea cyanobiont' 210A]|uniref:GIY-YIG nuclease family protein n=1 Tax=Nostoc sp. 'Peltigera membranacea cyanobiont' 210A TaxID=2014529 RepID=UPI000B954BDF|nr:GIY-YIG nuclease family protein [Nostoc sp. 'Peltigera membranacea cyanobiont' 210A]OYD96233.1 excinuclease ABC subunit C [Nostoc sp. 'Peltigera membranacea cyanobiont' 210A]
MLLENIKLSELPSIYLLEKEKLPTCPAIYFVSDSKGQILYIGRTVNLFQRWREHHRFQQLKRFNRRNRVSISWMTCSNDLNTLSKLENELIELHKPPLNWTKVVTLIRKITPVETALQQSLQQLAKLNTMIFGFDPISDEEPPTIYLVYPVYGQRGLSGSIRIALKNINKKASGLKWKEYHTDPKFLGKFGYWETQYNGIRIDLAPVQGLVHFMPDSTRRTLAGVEFMAFSREQLETVLENTPESKENISGLDVLEDDPIPLKLVDKNYLGEGKYKGVAEVEPWEELEPMPEGDVRVMTRQFLYVDDVEIEVCTSENGKHFVRYNVYWWIIYGRKNPDLEHDGIIRALKQTVDRLPSIRWFGYRFRLETILFSEDDLEVESMLLPLAMFEDLMRDKSGFNVELIEKIQSGEYKSKPDDQAKIKLYAWLQRNSVSSLLKLDKS